MPEIIVRLLGGVAILLGAANIAFSEAVSSAPLQLEAKIPLGKVNGRIDHMAVDPRRGRLFVAELGNNSVAVVDINARKLVRVLSGLKEPQGLAYIPTTDTLYVANAGDGSVRLFRGDEYIPADTIEFGDDADNIRFDPAANRVVIGYGSGALAVIDAANQRKIADISLNAHPESFQLALNGTRAYVNLPRSRSISVIDTISGKQIAAWPMRGMTGNFAMAHDSVANRVVVAFRNPAKLVVFSTDNGGIVESAETCGDIDDVFVDTKRQRIYASCSEGFLDVFDTQSAPYHRAAPIRTVAGARTSLFVPELDRLFVAAPANFKEPAAIWVFRPTQ